MSRPSEGIMLLDALKVPLDSLRKPLTENQVDIAWNSDPFLFTDDGLLIFAVTKKEGYGVLSIVDSLSQDLVWSSPAQGETHVARDAEITLRFALPLEGASSEYAPYVDLKAIGEGEVAESIPHSLSVSPDNPRELLITVDSAFAAGQEYELSLTGVLGSRRTEGLFEHTLTFVAGSGSGNPVEILDVTPSTVSTSGGVVTGSLDNADS